MDTEELKEKLKHVMEKERILYELEDALKEAEEGIVGPHIEKMTFERPSMEEFHTVIERPKYGIVAGCLMWYVGVAVVWGAFFILPLVINIESGRDESAGAYIWGPIGMVVFVLISIFFMKMIVGNITFKRKKRKIIRADLIRYEQAKKEYLHSVSAEEEKYQHAVRTAEMNKETVLRALHKKLDGPIAEARRTVMECYEGEGKIIYPKYRNFVAVCTLYEYLESGRVYSLDGPEGAYNLYEREIRQNAVIYKLDAIRGNLEKIKDNQYRLYQIVKQTNNELRNVRKAVEDISSTTDRILDEAYVLEKITESIDTTLLWRL